MKQVSQEEFEQYIIAYLDGEKTKKQIIAELETEARTLNNKIHELADLNPVLYQSYIKGRPYRPKFRRDVGAITLALAILKEEGTMAQTAQNYQIGIRTIRRKIDTLKKSTNPLEREAYELCRIIGYYHRRRKPIESPDLKKRIEKVIEALEQVKPVECIDNVEIKRRELREIEKTFNKLCETMSKRQAAKAMGYTANRIYKLLNQLYRIEIELNAKQKADFKESLKVETMEQQPIETAQVSSEELQQAIQKGMEQNKEEERD